MILKSIVLSNYLKKLISCGYDLPLGCSGKLTGAILQPYGPCFGIWVIIYGSEKYHSINQNKTQLHHSRRDV